MTATSENSHDRIDRLEATLTRFAELSFQSYRHHDETLSRLEANSTRHDEALNRLEANSVRHDQAITQLLEVTNRNSEAISRLEANSTRHDQAIAQLLEVTSRNSESINRMEDAITNLTATVANNNTRLTDRLDAIALQSAAERETFIAEIREIWRYLRYQPRLGRTGHDDA